MIYNNILETIGKTPIVRINRIAPEHVTMYVKVEAFNPMSSVKDRLAYAIILDAEKRGVLKPGQTVVEATSGNTGVALAMVCAARGYPFVAVMAESFSIERRKVMRGLGAKVILTPAAERGTGMVKKAQELSEAHGWFWASQFENPANPAFHRATTGPEILSDFADKRLDYWVTGWGTGGTMTGAGEVIKAARPDIQIVATEPEAAQLLAGKEWQPHKIQGWTPDFVPGVLNREIFDAPCMHRKSECACLAGARLHEQRDSTQYRVGDCAATAQALAHQEGIFTGISGGGTFAAALKAAKDAPEGSVLLAMLPDTAERYLSTPLFADVAEGSDDEWLTTLSQ